MESKGRETSCNSWNGRKEGFHSRPTISASGELLPMQTIYFGQTTVSSPSKKAAQYDEAAAFGFKFEPSKSETYWSTQATMRSLANDTIAPYFDKKKDSRSRNAHFGRLTIGQSTDPKIFSAG
jgi:hypothetical protein